MMYPDKIVVYEILIVIVLYNYLLDTTIIFFINVDYKGGLFPS